MNELPTTVPIPLTDGETPPKTLPLDQLNGPLVDRHQTEEQITAMADSIAVDGQLNDIVVTADSSGTGYRVVAGWTRCRAHQRLGLPTIRARVISRDAAALLMFAVSDNTVRTNLNWLDAANQAALVLRTTGETQNAVAKRLGYTPSKLSRLLKFPKLEPYLQEALKAGRLTFDDANALASIPEPARRLELFEELQAGTRRRGSLRTLAQKSSKAPIQTVRVGGQALRLAADADPVNTLKAVAKDITATLAAFRASGLSSDGFAAWLAQREGQ